MYQKADWPHPIKTTAVIRTKKGSDLKKNVILPKKRTA